MVSLFTCPRRFGNSEIFNPWSVINFFRNDLQPRAYWQATGSNEIIGEVLSGIDKDISDKLRLLIQGEKVVSAIDTGVIYPQVIKNPSSVFSFLLVAGYLKAVKSSMAVNGDFICEVAIPNKEISFVYRKEILSKLDYIIPQSSVVSVLEALYSGDAEQLEKRLETLLLQSASCFDTVGENFYHGFLLGLCAALEPYKSEPNRESGVGRHDIQMVPSNKTLPGIIIELKAEKSCSSDELKRLAVTALKQINDKKYDTELKSSGITNIIKFGVAFSGKNVVVISERECCR